MGGADVGLSYIREETLSKQHHQFEKQVGYFGNWISKLHGGAYILDWGDDVSRILGGSKK